MKYLFGVLLSFFCVSVFAQSPGNDWADLSKYREANATLSVPAKGEYRVVFLGSSIIEFWKDLDPDYFSKNFYIDRGISGQVSPQLLIRFQQDVINLHPHAVIILAGSNDLSKDTSHISYVRIMDNIKSMVELAKYNHIKVLLCTYVPIGDYPWRKGLHPASKIMKLNKMISDYAKKESLTVLDYFTPLVNKNNGQKANLTKDGVHPNLQGYRLLEKVTDSVVHEVLHF